MNDSSFIALDNLPLGGAYLYLLPGGENFVVTQDILVETKLGTQIIPAGFVTDLASIPKGLRSIISVMGKHAIAAILHDLWYRIPSARKIGRMVITKEDADSIFLAEMADLGVSWWKRRLMYRAVRVGGASSWRE